MNRYRNAIQKTIDDNVVYGLCEKLEKRQQKRFMKKLLHYVVILVAAAGLFYVMEVFKL